MTDKPDTRSMVGLLYVLKDEACGRCEGKGHLPSETLITFTCPACSGVGFRTFKVELSEAIKDLKRIGAI